MAMKTKKERFHVGALNRDLQGEMSKEREGEEEERTAPQLPSSTLPATAVRRRTVVKNKKKVIRDRFSGTTSSTHRFGI